MTDAGVRGPLTGVRVLSLAQNVPGPAAIARLVAMGASATKIEPPGGDPLASMCAPWYQELHRGVEVRAIDLKTQTGLAAFWDLAVRADVFFTSQRPSALVRLGIDPASTSPRTPLLRSVALVGDTADPETAGHDLTYMAQAGLLSASMPPALFADLMGAERACTAVLAVLRDPPGSHRVVGLLNSLDGLTGGIRHGMTTPGGLLGGGNPAYGIYPTRDGHVAVAALEPHFRARLYAALELPDGSSLHAALAARTAEEWERWAAELDLPIAALRSRGSG